MSNSNSDKNWVTSTPRQKRRRSWSCIDRDESSHGKLAASLGISRYETDALLKRHNVTEDLATYEEYLEQVRDLREKLGQ